MVNEAAFSEGPQYLCGPHHLGGISDRLRHNTQVRPEKSALAFGDGRVRYLDLDSRTNQFAHIISKLMGTLPSRS